MTGCEHLKKDSRLSEGVIEYEVSYPKMDPSSLLIELLPTKMTMHFRDDEFMTDLAAGFGMFRMNVISNGDDKEMSQMVKLIKERYVVVYDEAAARKSNEHMPAITIEQTSNVKKIAGYECKEAIVHVQNAENETYKIYYTDKIRLKAPNWFTQFTDIEGVLMEYQVERYNLCSKFVASKVLQQEVEDNLFEVPEGYKRITEDEMNEKMQEIFNNFSE